MKQPSTQIPMNLNGSVKIIHVHSTTDYSELWIFVTPEGIWADEGLGTGETCQPHPQVLSAHVCADCSMWGWLPLCATLNLALKHPLDAPNCRWRGVMWAGIATSKSGDAAKEGTSGASSVSLATRMEASGTASSGSWGCGLEMMADGVWWGFWMGVGQRIQGNVIWLPSGDHIDIVPLILPLLLQFSQGPPSPVTVLPPSAHWPSLVDPNPEQKREKMGSITKIKLKREWWQNGLKDWTMPGRKKGDIPLTIISALLLQEALEDPHLHPWLEHPQLLLLLGLFSWLLSLTWLINRQDEHRHARKFN